MIKMKNLISLFFLSFLSLTIFAQETVTIDGIVYELNNNGEAAVGNSDWSSETIIIPESVCFDGKNYLVTSLKDYCFLNCGYITSITLPSSIRSIGEACFNSCGSLKNINLPEGVTSLGNRCFEYCGSLVSINLPNSITSLGEACFRKCNKLFSITLPDGITSLKNACFHNCI